jgi:large subunit ribosomal protein L35
MPKNKSHKGLLKRVRVTKTGKIKLQRAFGRHLRSHKSGQTIRKYRRPKFAVGPDARRLRGLLQLKAGRPGTGPAAKTTTETPTES